jgi:hypothetical protein
MSALTEPEIFSCLAENFKLAAQHCEDLAKLPRKGPTYIKFRAELKLLEGACRQAAYWRQDARWLRIGLFMEEVHKRAGDWLRGYKLPSGQRVTHREGTIHPLFMKLADNLRAGQRQAENLRTRKTERTGMILPKAAPAPHRDTRPVQVLMPDGFQKRRSGLIVPSGAAA